MSRLSARRFDIQQPGGPEEENVDILEVVPSHWHADVERRLPSDRAWPASPPQRRGALVMRPPETRYATSDDGVSIAFQSVGDGPPDLVFELENFGNVDILWEWPEMADLFERLASFSRLILYDWRGSGLSGGRCGFPNLETRTRDILTVLNALRSSRAVLVGERTAGAAHAILAATHPDRVRALVWVKAVATRRWSPEYPWGRTPDELRYEVEWVRDGMGRTSFAREWLGSASPDQSEDEELAAKIARIDRHFVAPSTAVDWLVSEGETDVRSVLPLIRCPTLVLDHEHSPTGAAESRYVHSLIPRAELALMRGDLRPLPFGNRSELTDLVRRFATRDPRLDDRDTVLSTVLFTDIVGSTERQAATGDRAWAELIGRHHAIVREALERYRGVENDTAGDGFFATFDGPAAAIRCALEIVDRLRPLEIQIRAGIHVGECEVVDGKHAGLAVTIGARIAANAHPSEVLVSRTVRDLSAGSGFAFEDRGDHALKGVPESWQVYRVSGGT